jgi:hypothetical protein
MLRQFKRLVERYRLRRIELEVLALEKYCDKFDPKVLELIRSASQRIAEERAKGAQQ